MDITDDTQPIGTFRDRSAEIIRRLNETKRPVMLTVDGKAAAVLQDADSYQRLLDLAAQASEDEALRQGLEDVAHGRTIPAETVFAEMRRRHGIPG